MNVRDEVLAQIRQVGLEQDTRLAPLVDALPLVDSGLDSLGFAILVARLESTLEIDPFSESEDAGLPITLGELIGFYEKAAK